MRCSAGLTVAPTEFGRDPVAAELRALVAAQQRIEAALVNVTGGHEETLRHIEAELLAISAVQRNAEGLLRELAISVSSHSGDPVGGSLIQSHLPQHPPASVAATLPPAVASERKFHSRKVQERVPGRRSEDDDGDAAALPCDVESPLSVELAASLIFEDVVPSERESGDASGRASLEMLEPVALVRNGICWADDLKRKSSEANGRAVLVDSAKTAVHRAMRSLRVHIEACEDEYGVCPDPMIDCKGEDERSLDGDGGVRGSFLQALTPAGAGGAEGFLNAAGVTMQRGRRLGPSKDGSENFYCGRVLGEDVMPDSDGQCGPLYGPQCPDCLMAQLQLRKSQGEDEDEDNAAIASIVETIRNLQVHEQWNIEPRMQHIKSSNRSDAMRSKSIFGMVNSIRMPFSRTLTETTQPYSKRHFDCLVLPPYCRRRTFWDLLSILFIAIDFIVVPLMFFEDFTVSDNWFFTSAAFWTLDIPMSMATGYQDGDNMEVRIKKTFYRYALRRLPLDLIVDIPMWIEVAARLNGNAGTELLPRIGNVMRLLRFFRMLRMLKLGRLLYRLHDGFRSLVRQTLMEMCYILVSMLAFCHLVACVWYLVGVSSGADGWVQRSNYDGRGWVQQYVCALHWSVTQFQGQMEITPFTIEERIFGEVVIVIALLSTSVLVAGITNSIIKVHNFYLDRSQRRKKLKQFLVDFQVSTPLVMQAMRSCLELEDQGAVVNADECLHLVPHKLRLALRCDIFLPFVRQHCFFRSCELRNSMRWLLKAVCKHVLQHRYFLPEEVVFDQGLLAESAFVVMHGSLDYVCNVGTFTVGPGEWLRDAALWVPWNNVGRLATLTHGQLFSLGVKDFATLVQSRIETHYAAATFARRFLRDIQLLKKSSVTDLVMLTRVSFLQRVQGSIVKFGGRLLNEEEEDEDEPHANLTMKNGVNVARYRTLTRNRSSAVERDFAESGSFWSKMAMLRRRLGLR